jgi:FKBP-type peptidyl-prolyl cis-trans isomerase
MTGMQEGGRVKFILPPWLTNTEDEPEWGESSNLIFDIELKHVITDILKWEEDSMKAYANLHYPGLDTLSSNFYLKKLSESTKDSLESGSVKVYYIGRLLDGFVFDTNIKDTAKKYGIYAGAKKKGDSSSTSHLFYCSMVVWVISI